MPKLLSDSESSSDEEQPTQERLNVNKKFASQLEQRERTKDLHRAKDLGTGDDEEEDDSESETEDEDAELLSPELDLKIVNTIKSLRKKDPRIYDKNSQWFSDNEEDDEDSDEEDTKTGKDKKKKYKDVLREQLLAEGNPVDDYELDEDLKASYRLKNDNLSKKQLAYDAEQDEIRKAFLQAAKTGDDSSSEEENGRKIVRAKAKSAKERRAEERQLALATEEMTQLGSFVEDDKDKEAFLTNYLLHQLWRDPGDTIRAGGEEVDSEEDEAAVETAEMFENKYNFRFEELQDAKARLEEAGEDQSPGAAFGLGLAFGSAQVIGHARQVPGSLRREDDKDKRKAQREARKERKEREKRQKAEELKRLKNLKKQALQERLLQIGQVGGLTGVDSIDPAFLDEDWDPEKHAQLMAAAYDDSYYAQGDEALDLDHPMDDLLEGDELLYADEEEEQGAGEEGAGQKKGKHSKKKKAAAVAVAASAEEAQEVHQMLDELYALDYEDIVAGLPCRFKYQTVEPDDFGLDTADILLADDAQLNKYVSLKHLAPYNAKKYSKTEKDWKRKQKHFQHSLKSKLSELAAQEEAAEAVAAASAEKSKSKKGEEAVAVAVEEAEGNNKRKRRKRKQSASATNNNDNDGENDGEAQEEAAEAVEAVVQIPVENKVIKDKGKDKKKKFRDDHKQNKSNKKDNNNNNHKNNKEGGQQKKKKEKDDSSDPVKKRMKLYE